MRDEIDNAMVEAAAARLGVGRPTTTTETSGYGRPARTPYKRLPIVRSDNPRFAVLWAASKRKGAHVVVIQDGDGERYRIINEANRAVLFEGNFIETVEFADQMPRVA